MPSPLVEAWRQNAKVNYLLLDALTKEGLAAQYTPKTRTVTAQFAHLHNVRVSHLDRRGPHGAGMLKAFSRGAQPGKRELKAALKASDKAIAELLEHCEEVEKVKSWQGSPTTYLGYFLAHEAHHRGLALVALRIAGVKLPKSIMYGIWYEWRKGP